MSDYKFYFEDDILITEFKSDFDEDRLYKAYLEVKATFPDKDIRFHMYKDRLGYWNAYDYKLEFDVYCATMKKSKAIEYLKQYKEDVENSSN